MSEKNAATADGAGESRTVRLTIPAKPEYITLSRLALTGLTRVRPLTDETLADLKLALTEACSNSVRHAYDERRRSRLDQLRAAGRPPDRRGRRRRHGLRARHRGRRNGDDVELSEGGLGIAIIRSIADEVEIGGGANGRGSRLRFVKLLP